MKYGHECLKKIHLMGTPPFCKSGRHGVTILLGWRSSAAKMPQIFASFLSHHLLLPTGPTRRRPSDKKLLFFRPTRTGLHARISLRRDKKPNIFRFLTQWSCIVSLCKSVAAATLCSCVWIRGKR